MHKLLKLCPLNRQDRSRTSCFLVQRFFKSWQRRREKSNIDTQTGTWIAKFFGIQSESWSVLSFHGHTHMQSECWFAKSRSEVHDRHEFSVVHAGECAATKSTGWSRGCMMQWELTVCMCPHLNPATIILGMRRKSKELEALVEPVVE